MISFFAAYTRVGGRTLATVGMGRRALTAVTAMAIALLATAVFGSGLAEASTACTIYWTGKTNTD